MLLVKDNPLIAEADSAQTRNTSHIGASAKACARTGGRRARVSSGRGMDRLSAKPFNMKGAMMREEGTICLQSVTATIFW